MKRVNSKFLRNRLFLDRMQIEVLRGIKFSITNLSNRLYVKNCQNFSLYRLNAGESKQHVPYNALPNLKLLVLILNVLGIFITRSWSY